MSVVDLSHPVREGMLTYPGLPGPQVDDYLSFEESRRHYDIGTEFQIRRLCMLTSTGTYLDAPRHRFRDGADVAQIPLDRCVGLPAVVVDVRAVIEIGPDHVPDDAVSGSAVLFLTGWGRHWGTEKYGAVEHPHLEPATADLLARRGVALVGIDSVNVDGTSNEARPIHTTLLQAGVLIVENLTNLAAIPRRGAEFTAAPLAFEGLPSFPVRAFAG